MVLAGRIGVGQKRSIQLIYASIAGTVDEVLVSVGEAGASRGEVGDEVKPRGGELTPERELEREGDPIGGVACSGCMRVPQRPQNTKRVFICSPQ
jgi:hypothetical protein